MSLSRSICDVCRRFSTTVMCVFTGRIPTGKIFSAKTSSLSTVIYHVCRHFSTMVMCVCRRNTRGKEYSGRTLSSSTTRDVWRYSLNVQVAFSTSWMKSASRLKKAKSNTPIRILILRSSVCLSQSPSGCPSCVMFDNSSPKKGVFFMSLSGSSCYSWTVLSVS